MSTTTPQRNMAARLREVTHLPVSHLVPLLGVSRQAYYKWLRGGAMDPLHQARVEEMIATYVTKELTMQQTQVEEYIANLLSIGFSREQIAQKAYDFALTLQTDMQTKDGETYVSAQMMMLASEWVKNAWPGARRIYDRRNQMW